MPKIYDQKSGSESGSNKWGGGGHEQVQKRGMIWAIAVIVALVVIFLLYRVARSEELQAAMNPSEAPTVAFSTASMQ